MAGLDVLKTVAQRSNSKNWALLVVLFSISVIACSDRRTEDNHSLAVHLPLDPELNVLIVSFDALRADALGLYGYTRPTSPRLDEFAQSALVFERAHTAAPVTPTSFAAAFTGQLPFRVFYGWNLIDTDTIAGVFAAANRRTFALINNTQLVAERNFQQGFQRYDVVHLPDEDVLAFC